MRKGYYMRLESVYTMIPNDPQACVLGSEAYPTYGDGVHDDTANIQKAINELKTNENFGIVYVPEGTYLISDTIYVPKAIRLIGCGKNRPLFVLKDHAEGFDRCYPDDKGGYKYMIWYCDGVVDEDHPVRDANPGTFYSAFSNINIKLGDGNPYAVGLRTHYAQHSFVNHCVIDAGNCAAGMYEAGNEMENVVFIGGDYGMKTTKCSPGWPYMAVDCAFEGQKKSAIHSRELGLTMLRTSFKNVPKVIDTEEQFMDKIYLEDCSFENVSGPALNIRLADNMFTMWTLKNVDCMNVPTLVLYPETGKTIAGQEGIYRIDRFTHGVVLDQMEDPGEVRTILETTPLAEMPAPVATDIPNLPPMEKWVNVLDLGVKGDNLTDDTAAIQAAINTHKVLYFPQGWYKVTDTLTLKDDTVLIGLHPIATQLALPECTEAYTEMGPAKPLIQSGRGANIINGIGIDTGSRNPRACGLKWVASENSYVNDVKFVGGHGTMIKDQSKPWVPTYNPSRTADADPEKKWDYQYWSFWVTENGGGVFKDVWTASTYACAGFYADGTSTRGRIYCMSLEHHVRNEAKFKNVSNWKVYAFQTEEEVAESQMCQPLELQNCHDMTFATYYSFRVIWLPNPWPQAIRLYDCSDIEWINLSNYTQVKYTLTDEMVDVNTGKIVRPWQIAYFMQGPAPEHKMPELPMDQPVKLFGGFEFTDAACVGPDGSFYFADSRWYRIFKIDAATGALSMVRDVPLRPLSMYFDTKGNLLVVTEYMYARGMTRNGQPIKNVKPSDAAGTSYGGWYTPDAVVRVYAMDPADPENTMKVIDKVSAKDISGVKVALHPANRWRDDNSYLEFTVQDTEDVYVAPDGVTVIPDFYDLIRSNTLVPAVPGKTALAVDEYYKRIMAFDVSEKGFLRNVRTFLEHGEYSVINDLENDRVYVADGDLLVCNAAGEILKRITMEDRPGTLALSPEGDVLFVTARSNVYAVKVK